MIYAHRISTPKEIISVRKAYKGQQSRGYKTWSYPFLPAYSVLCSTVIAIFASLLSFSKLLTSAHPDIVMKTWCELGVSTVARNQCAYIVSDCDKCPPSKKIGPWNVQLHWLFPTRNQVTTCGSSTAELFKAEKIKFCLLLQCFYCLFPFNDERRTFQNGTGFLSSLSFPDVLCDPTNVVWR